MTRLYLDHNATTPLKQEARDAMIAAMDIGNPSSVHAEGRKAKGALEGARKSLAVALDAPETGIVFTSGGTEAINMALWGMVRREKDPVRRIFISALEHSAVRDTAQVIAEAGLATIEVVPALSSGAFDVEWLTTRLESYDPAEEGTFLACLMLANNETGVLQPIEKIRTQIFQKGGFLFVDGVQAVGKVPLSFNELQADLMAVSAHKIGGPKGCGALLTKPGIPLATFMTGGGQELRRRGGTENIIGIAGFGAACAVLDVATFQVIATVRDQLQARLLSQNISGLKVWGEEAARLPNTLCFSAPGFAAETQLMVLDLAGISASAGSACSSGKVAASPIIHAMGASEDEAKATIRVSFGGKVEESSVEKFMSAWLEGYGRAVKKGKAA